MKTPILHPADNRGSFQLSSDTSKTAKGSAMYQLQNSIPKLIGYTSKRLPPAAQNYLITELELLGLHVNISQFKTATSICRF